MKTFWKAAIAALSFGALAGCQPYDGYYEDGYYGGGGGFGMSYNDGYCDSYGCPSNYWDMPVYYGSIYYGGSWVNGPFYYRDFGGGRQYWLRGGWRNDDWRGDRPQAYRNFRYGPALGRDFYRSDRFRNERNFGNNNDNRPNFGQGRGGDFGRGGDNRPDFGRGGRGNDNRPDFGRGGDNRPGVGQGRGGFGGRGNQGAERQPPQPQPQAQPDRGGRGFGDGGGRGGFGNRGGGFQRMDNGPRDNTPRAAPPQRDNAAPDRFGRDRAPPQRGGDVGGAPGSGRGRGPSE